MPEESDDLSRYIDAARRQCSISQYHLSCLRTQLRPPAPGQDAPPIPVQAHFEGVVVSAMAAVDKIARATNSGLSLSLNQGELVTGAMAELGRRIGSVKSWFESPIGRDLRRIRVRIIHYAYAKTPDPVKRQWLVETAGAEYAGSRALLDYASAAVEYGAVLSALLPKIEARLRAEKGGQAQFITRY